MLTFSDASSNVVSDSSKSVTEKFRMFNDEVRKIKVDTDGTDAISDDVTVKIEQLRQDAVDGASKWKTDYDGKVSLIKALLT